MPRRPLRDLRVSLDRRQAYPLTETTDIVLVAGSKRISNAGIPRPDPPAARTPAARRPVAREARLSDRAIAWLFITPTIVAAAGDQHLSADLDDLSVSFTNYRANRPGRDQVGGHAQLRALLSSEDIWGYLQATAHFVCWTMFLQVLLGFGLALADQSKVPGHGFWTTVILLPMMLSPAVVGVFWTYLYQPQSRASSTTSSTSSPTSADFDHDRRVCASRPGRSSWSIPGCGRPSSC